MDATKMNAVLAEMTPEEVQSAPWFVAIFQRSGCMSDHEAAEWRLRIRAWEAFLRLDPRQTARN